MAAAPGLAVVGYSAEGKIIFFDAAAEQLFGYRADRIVGFSSFEVLHEAGAFASFTAPVTQAGERQIELSARTRTGETLPVRATILREDDCLYVLYQDISPIARAHERIAELRDHLRRGTNQSEKEAEFLRELLRHMIDTVQIGLAVQELTEGMVAYVNEGFERITGLRNMEVMGHTFGSALSAWPATRERFCSFIEALTRSARGEAAAPPPGSWELEFPSGKRTVSLYGRPIIVEGHPSQYLLLIIEDNTERQRLQLQLVQSEKLAAIGQLAAGIAHEIRNPLNTIHSALFDLREVLPDPPAGAREDIAISLEEIKRVQDIINNLLDFARESERVTGRADMNDVVRKTIRLVRHDLENRRIAITFEEGEMSEAAISNNALKQILINLITNAAQAMNAGGTLGVRTSRRSGQVPLSGGTSAAASNTQRLAEISSHRSRSLPYDVYGEHAVLEITDTGPGIAPDLLRDIFNPFFTTKEPGSGTGLGLSVVHSLIRDAGGAIKVRSAPGEGSTFTIELPIIAV